jgi:hypothetical protein
LSEVEEHKRVAAESLARFRKAADAFVSPSVGALGFGGGSLFREQGRDSIEVEPRQERGGRRSRDWGIDRESEVEREEGYMQKKPAFDRGVDRDSERAMAWEEEEQQQHRSRDRGRVRDQDRERAKGWEKEDEERQTRRDRDRDGDGDRDRERERERERGRARDGDKEEEPRGGEWQRGNAREREIARERGGGEQGAGEEGHMCREEWEGGVRVGRSPGLRDAGLLRGSVDEILYRAQKTQEAAVRALSPGIGRSHSPAAGPSRVVVGERGRESERGSVSPPSHSSLLRSLSPAYAHGRPFLGRAPSSGEIARQVEDIEDQGTRSRGVGNEEQPEGDQEEIVRRGVRSEWEREREQDCKRERERERARDEGRQQQVMSNSVNVLKFFDSDTRRDGDGQQGHRRHRDGDGQGINRGAINRSDNSAYQDPRADRRPDTGGDSVGRNRRTYAPTTDHQYAGTFLGPVAGGNVKEAYEERFRADLRLQYEASAHGVEDAEGFGHRAMDQGSGPFENRREFDDEEEGRIAMAMRTVEGVCVCARVYLCIFWLAFADMACAHDAAV